MSPPTLRLVLLEHLTPHGTERSLFDPLPLQRAFIPVLVPDGLLHHTLGLHGSRIQLVLFPGHPGRVLVQWAQDDDGDQEGGQGDGGGPGESGHIVDPLDEAVGLHPAVIDKRTLRGGTEVANVCYSTYWMSVVKPREDG